MKGRSWRWLLVSFAVLLILAVGGGATFVYLRSHTTSSPPQTTVVWKVPGTSLSQKDQQGIETALKAQLTVGNGFAGETFTIIEVRRQADWDVVNSLESRKPFPSGLEFIAHYQSGTWTVWLPISRGFCDQLQQVPDTLMTATEKRYFCL